MAAIVTTASASVSKNRKRKRKKRGKESVKAIAHYDVFYNQAPPGLVKEDKEKPEDSIPDLPENQEAREFLSKAPSKGLWMPLGKEVKVMKCWRCKTYGHRTGDRECPMFVSGNTNSEMFRNTHEDPMFEYIMTTKQEEKEERIKHLQALLEASSSDSDSSSSSSTSSSSSGRSRSPPKHSKHKKNKKKHRRSSKSKKKKKKHS